MGVGEWVHSVYGFQVVDKKEKRKERERKEEGGGASSFPISAEKEETEAHRGRFWRGKRETRTL